MTGSGGHSAVRLLEEGVPRLDPANYKTTGSRNTFELMVRAPGRSSTSSFLVSSLFQRRSGPAFVAGVSRFPLFKGMGSSGQPLPYAVHSVWDPTTGRLDSVTQP